MKMQVFAIFDAASGVYGRPIFTQSTGIAIRSFTDEVNRDAADNAMNRHSGDFSLWHLGAFDDNQGRFEQLDHGPIRVVTAAEVLLKGAA